MMPRVASFLGFALLVGGEHALAPVTARPESRPTAESTARLDHLLEIAHVRSALRRNEITNRPMPSLSIELDPEFGELLPSGVADDQAFKEEAGRLARAAPGIASVRNDLIVLRPILEP